MRRFKDIYLLHRYNSTGLTDLQELLCKKCERPLSIGELDEKVKRYITYLMQKHLRCKNCGQIK